MPMREENIQISFRGERRSGGVGGGIVVVVCASISAHVSHSFMSFTNAHFFH